MKTCNFIGCTRLRRALGLCAQHYARLRRKNGKHAEASRQACRKWRNKPGNRIKKNRAQRRIRKGLKILVLAHYGKRSKILCAWPRCKIADIDMLSLDHVKNDGALRRKIGEPRASELYRYLIQNNFPPGMQTLCGNHQMKKEALRRKKLTGEK